MLKSKAEWNVLNSIFIVFLCVDCIGVCKIVCGFYIFWVLTWLRHEITRSCYFDTILKKKIERKQQTGTTLYQTSPIVAVVATVECRCCFWDSCNQLQFSFQLKPAKFRNYIHNTSRFWHCCLIQWCVHLTHLFIISITITWRCCIICTMDIT